MSTTDANTFRLSRMGTAVHESATLRQAARVAELRAGGRTIFNFTVGEPDCDAPEAVRAAAHAAIDEGYTRYTPTAGLPVLRQRVAEYYSRWHARTWEPSQTIVGAGAKQIIWNALASIVDPGDEVVLIAPYWISYSAYVELLGGRIRVLQTTAENDFKATRADMQAVLGARTRAILFNNPVNPTGVVYSRDELHELFAPVVAHGAAVISDEIYERLVYEGEHVSPLQVYPELADRFMLASGASKSFAMTGWRIGFGLGPPTWIQAMITLQSHTTGNANSVAQRAAWAALALPDGDVERIRERFRARRDIALDILQRCEGLRYAPPHGTFYFFLDVTPFYGAWQGGRRIEDSEALAEHLLEKHGVAVVPGRAFAHDGGIRISYTVPDDELRAGLEVLVRSLNERA